jgi:SulP family sulfate permease
VNVRAGAGSRLASVTHALTLAVIMLAAAPLVAHIPLAALAGVLLATAIRMVEVGSLAALARSTRSDAMIMALTATATLALDLVAAVAVGLALACLLALRKIATASTLEQVPLDVGDHHAEEASLLAEHIVAYRFDGPLFFAAAHRFLLELSDVGGFRVVILRMSRVSTIDGTGALVLRDAIERLEHRGITVYLSGLQDRHVKALDALAVLDRLREQGRVFGPTTDAIAAARDQLHHTGILPPGESQQLTTNVSQ